MSSNKPAQYETQQDEAILFRGSLFYAVAVLLLAFVVLMGRLWHLQVLRGKDLAAQAEQNRVRTLQLAPTRGKILDRDGKIIVDNGLSFDVYFLPARLEPDKREPFLIEACERLAIPPDRALSLFRQSGAGPVRIAADVDREIVGMIKHEQMLSETPYPLDIKQETKRVYPLGDVVSQALGYCRRVSTPGYDDLSHSQYEGRSGLELVYNEFLSGKDGWEDVEENALGRRIRTLSRTEPVPGMSLQLNIDLDLQRTMAEAMAGKSGAAIALDPRNGAILAMHSAPTYDPSVFSRFLDPEDWQSLNQDLHRPLMNRAIQGAYPPGSTFKVITGASALEEGAITYTTPITCTGGVQLGNRFFRCWLRSGHGTLTFHRALVQSCDTFFYRTGSRAGIDNIARYARAFGFDNPTGIDLPSEVSGTIPDREWKKRQFKDNPGWYPGETLNVAIGQGYVLVTPMQLALAYSAIANSGTLWRPRLAMRTLDLEGREVRRFEPEKMASLPLSEPVLKYLQLGLAGVVDEPGGTGRAASIPGVTVAGKTGTAQASQLVIKRPDGTIYREKGDHAWFVCYAPVDNPEIVIVVLLERSGHGGSIAAPIAGKILRTYFDKKNGVAGNAPQAPQPR